MFRLPLAPRSPTGIALMLTVLGGLAAYAWLLFASAAPSEHPPPLRVEPDPLGQGEREEHPLAFAALQSRAFAPQTASHECPEISPEPSAATATEESSSGQLHLHFLRDGIGVAGVRIRIIPAYPVLASGAEVPKILRTVKRSFTSDSEGHIHMHLPIGTWRYALASEPRFAPVPLHEDRGAEPIWREADRGAPGWKIGARAPKGLSGSFVIKPGERLAFTVPVPGSAPLRGRLVPPPVQRSASPNIPADPSATGPELRLLRRTRRPHPAGPLHDLIDGEDAGRLNVGQDGTFERADLAEGHYVLTASWTVASRERHIAVKSFELRAGRPLELGAIAAERGPATTLELVVQKEGQVYKPAHDAGWTLEGLIHPASPQDGNEDLVAPFTLRVGEPLRLHGLARGRWEVLVRRLSVAVRPDQLRPQTPPSVMAGGQAQVVLKLENPHPLRNLSIALHSSKARALRIWALDADDRVSGQAVVLPERFEDGRAELEMRVSTGAGRLIATGLAHPPGRPAPFAVATLPQGAGATCFSAEAYGPVALHIGPGLYAQAPASEEDPRRLLLEPHPGVALPLHPDGRGGLISVAFPRGYALRDGFGNLYPAPTADLQLAPSPSPSPGDR